MINPAIHRLIVSALSEILLLSAKTAPPTPAPSSLTASPIVSSFAKFSRRGSAPPSAGLGASLLSSIPAPQYRIIPTASHKKNRHQVMDGNSRMSRAQLIIAPIGTQGTRGVRKGRTRSGSVLRRARMPPATRMKAKRVPILQSSTTSLMLLTAANTATNRPVRIVVDHGVLNRG